MARLMLHLGPSGTRFLDVALADFEHAIRSVAKCRRASWSSLSHTTPWTRQDVKEKHQSTLPMTRDVASYREHCGFAHGKSYPKRGAVKDCRLDGCIGQVEPWTDSSCRLCCLFEACARTRGIAQSSPSHCAIVRTFPFSIREVFQDSVAFD
jgi:hypothetical protein